MYCPWMSPTILQGPTRFRRIGVERRRGRDIERRVFRVVGERFVVVPGGQLRKLKHISITPLANEIISS